MTIQPTLKDLRLCEACGERARCSTCGACAECAAAQYAEAYPEGLEEIAGSGRDGAVVVELVDCEPSAVSDERCPECEQPQWVRGPAVRRVRRTDVRAREPDFDDSAPMPF